MLRPEAVGQPPVARQALVVVVRRDQGPCDIYAAASMPCGAAYSMVRSLSSKYSGPSTRSEAGALPPTRARAARPRISGCSRTATPTRHPRTPSVPRPALSRSCMTSPGMGTISCRGSAGPSGNGNTLGRRRLRGRREQDLDNGRRSQGLRALCTAIWGVSDCVERYGQRHPVRQQGPGHLRARRRHALRRGVLLGLRLCLA
jgi:hypothetical protein